MQKLALYSWIASLSLAVSSLLLLQGLPSRSTFTAAAVVSAILFGTADFGLRHKRLAS